MKILGLQIPVLRYTDLFDDITSLSEQKIIFTPNPEICLRARQDRDFLNMLQQADYLTSDGIWLYIGYQIQDFSAKYISTLGKGGLRGVWFQVIHILLLPYFFFNLMFRRSMLYEKYWDRICGSDLTLDLLDFAERKNKKVIIIDLYKPDDAKKVASQEVFWPRLQQAYPKLRFDYHIYDPENKTDIIWHIGDSEGEILFSTLGMKSQEQSVIEIMGQCPNIKIGLGVGSSFDYITWFQKRAPKIFRSIGIEWLYRIFTSPGKIQRLARIYQAVIIFPITVLRSLKK